VQKGVEDFKSTWIFRVKLSENSSREMFFDINDNELIGLDDYLVALMRKQFIQIRTSSKN
jgi:hypothetical protein